MEDKRHLLSTPLHGVYIPAALLIAGIAIFDMSYLPYGVALAGLLAAWKFYRGNTKEVLDPVQFQEFELEDITPINHNTRLYRFSLPKPNDKLGLPVGQHITLQAQIGEEVVTEDYTPISADSDNGSFELLIKTYPDGKMSRHIAGLRPHQTINVKGPVGNMVYRPNMVKHLGMIAGGTGITPMLQIIDAIVKNPEDLTTVSLVYANKTVDDILLKEDFDELAEKYPNFEVHYVVERSQGDAENWEGSLGYVTKDIIKKHISSKPAPDTKILVCGPSGLIDSVRDATESLGFEKAQAVSSPDDQVFVF